MYEVFKKGVIMIYFVIFWLLSGIVGYIGNVYKDGYLEVGTLLMFPFIIVGGPLLVIVLLGRHIEKDLNRKVWKRK